MLGLASSFPKRTVKDYVISSSLTAIIGRSGLPNRFRENLRIVWFLPQVPDSTWFSSETIIGSWPGLDPSSWVCPGRLLLCPSAGVTRHFGQGDCSMRRELMHDQNSAGSSTDGPKMTERVLREWTVQPFESRYRNVHGTFVFPP